MSNLQLPNLHDAVLIRASVEWADATATIQLRTRSDVTVTLVAREIDEFIMTRREAWGPSVFVNEVRLDEHDESHVNFEIEMQSGDVIRVGAAQLDIGFRLEALGGPSRRRVFIRPSTSRFALPNAAPAALVK